MLYRVAPRFSLRVGETRDIYIAHVSQHPECVSRLKLVLARIKNRDYKATNTYDSFEDVLASFFVIKCNSRARDVAICINKFSAVNCVLCVSNDEKTSSCCTRSTGCVATC